MLKLEIIQLVATRIVAEMEQLRREFALELCFDEGLQLLSRIIYLDGKNSGANTATPPL